MMRSQYKADGKMHEQERDVAKYWTDSKVDIALYGLENQTKVDRTMPLRVMGYDGSEGLDHYVNDYNIHVVNVAWLTEEEIERFQSDFKLVARFFVEKRKGNKDWMKDNKQEIVHVDAILKLLSVMTGDKDYEAIVRNGDAKEVHTMCEVLQYYKNEGRAEGRAEGKLEVRLELAVKMLDKNFSEETILSLGITKEELVKAKDLCAVSVG